MILGANSRPPRVVRQDVRQERGPEQHSLVGLVPDVEVGLPGDLPLVPQMVDRLDLPAHRADGPRQSADVEVRCPDAADTAAVENEPLHRLVLAGAEGRHRVADPDIDLARIPGERVLQIPLVVAEDDRVARAEEGVHGGQPCLRRQHAGEEQGAVGAGVHRPRRSLEAPEDPLGGVGRGARIPLGGIAEFLPGEIHRPPGVRGVPGDPVESAVRVDQFTQDRARRRIPDRDVVRDEPQGRGEPLLAARLVGAPQHERDIGAGVQ